MSDPLVRYEWHGTELLQRVEREIDEAFQAVAPLAVRAARTSLTERDQRSAPGEAPTVYSGELRSGITTILKPQQLTLTVQSTRPGNVPALLEFGTAGQAERPFLRPALQGQWPTIFRELEDSLR